MRLLSVSINSLWPLKECGPALEIHVSIHTFYIWDWGFPTGDFFQCAMAYSCTASSNVFKLCGLLDCTLTHTDKMPRAYLILAIILLLSMSFHNIYQCSKNDFWKVEIANRTCLKEIPPLQRTNSSYRTCKWSDQDAYSGTAGMEDNYDLWKALLESYTLGLSYMKEEFSSMKKDRCVHTTTEVPPPLSERQFQHNPLITISSCIQS